MRILGVTASGISVGDYVLISTTILADSQGTISFNTSSLASTYKHLQVRAVMRTSGANEDGGNPLVRFNGDAGTNYAWHLMVSSGSSVASGSGANATAMLFAKPTGANSTSGSYGVAIMDILDAFSTTKNKTHRSVAGHATLQTGVFSGHWRNTNAITSIDILSNGASFVAGSRFSLYGIRG